MPSKLHIQLRQKVWKPFFRETDLQSFARVALEEAWKMYRQVMHNTIKKETWTEASAIVTTLAATHSLLAIRRSRLNTSVAKHPFILLFKAAASCKCVGESVIYLCTAAAGDFLITSVWLLLYMHGRPFLTPGYLHHTNHSCESMVTGTVISPLSKMLQRSCKNNS